jgi:hypothetical protein
MSVAAFPRPCGAIAFMLRMNEKMPRLVFFVPVYARNGTSGVVMKYAPLLASALLSAFALPVFAQQTLLLRQPAISAEHLAFVYAGDPDHGSGSSVGDDRSWRRCYEFQSDLARRLFTRLAAGFGD